jgi:hypothetical protein
VDQWLEILYHPPAALKEAVALTTRYYRDNGKN